MKSFNKVALKGRLHSYELEVKDTDNGEAIAGTVSIEASEDGAIVDVRFFAKPKYKSGKINKTYNILEDMIAGNYLTIVNDGADADWISIDGEINIDYYVGRDGAKSVDDLGKSQKIRGSFVNANKNHDYENSWRCDMLITRVEEIEEDAEKNRAHAARIHGYILDSFNERALGAKFDVVDEAAMNYVLGLAVEQENPLYSSVRGEFRKITTLIKREGAFSDDEIIEYDDLKWVLTWMPKGAYTFGEDITEDEYKAYLANLDEYKKEKFEDGAKKAEKDEKDNLVF